MLSITDLNEKRTAWAVSQGWVEVKDKTGWLKREKDWSAPARDKQLRMFLLPTIKKKRMSHTVGGLPTDPTSNKKRMSHTVGGLPTDPTSNSLSAAFGDNQLVEAGGDKRVQPSATAHGIYRAPTSESTVNRQTDNWKERKWKREKEREKMAKNLKLLEFFKGYCSRLNACNELGSWLQPKPDHWPHPFSVFLSVSGTLFRPLPYLRVAVFLPSDLFFTLSTKQTRSLVAWSPAGLLWKTKAPKLLSDWTSASISEKVNMSWGQRSIDAINPV